MDIVLTSIHSVCIAEIVSEHIELYDAQSALDLLATCGYQGSEHIIIPASCISPDFFDLKTGLAGDILQKFSTYRVRLAIVGDFSAYTSKSLKDFIYESNKTGRINFVSTIEEARNTLSR